MTLSARTFLAADQGALIQSLVRGGSLGPMVDAIGVRMSGPGLVALGREVATAADSLLGLDLGTMLTAGWRTHRALRAAAQATVADPEATEVVELASHRITSTYQPRIDIYVNDEKAYELQLTLSVRFDVHSLLATVRLAHAVELRCGQLDVTIQLSWSGGTLLERRGQIEAPLVVPVGAGFALLATTETQAAQFRGSSRVGEAGVSHSS